MLFNKILASGNVMIFELYDVDLPS